MNRKLLRFVVATLAVGVTHIALADSRRAALKKSDKPAASKESFDPKQGQKNWAVFVYAGGPGDQLSAAKKALTDKGLALSRDFYESQVSCHVGAEEALKVSGDAMALTVHFRSKQAARRFAATLSPPPSGIVHVKQMCAD